MTPDYAEILRLHRKYRENDCEPLWRVFVRIGQKLERADRCKACFRTHLEYSRLVDATCDDPFHSPVVASTQSTPPFVATPPKPAPDALREAAILEAAKRMQCLNAMLQLKTQCWNEIEEREQEHWIDLASIALSPAPVPPDGVCEGTLAGQVFKTIEMLKSDVEFDRSYRDFLAKQLEAALAPLPAVAAEADSEFWCQTCSGTGRAPPSENLVPPPVRGEREALREIVRVFVDDRGLPTIELVYKMHSIAKAALAPLPAVAAEAVDDQDPPMKWLIERLRGLAVELVADPKTPWIGERDPKQHICWTAADRLAPLLVRGERKAVAYRWRHVNDASGKWTYQETPIANHNEYLQVEALGVLSLQSSPAALSPTSGDGGGR